MRTGEDLFSPVFLSTWVSNHSIGNDKSARACAHTHGTGVIRSLINGGIHSLLCNDLYLSSLLHPYMMPCHCTAHAQVEALLLKLPQEDLPGWV